jgi:hypothetical protein
MPTTNTTAQQVACNTVHTHLPCTKNDFSAHGGCGRATISALYFDLLCGLCTAPSTYLKKTKTIISTI